MKKTFKIILVLVLLMALLGGACANKIIDHSSAYPIIKRDTNGHAMIVKSPVTLTRPKAPKPLPPSLPAPIEAAARAALTNAYNELNARDARIQEEKLILAQEQEILKRAAQSKEERVVYSPIVAGPRKEPTISTSDQPYVKVEQLPKELVKEAKKLDHRSWNQRVTVWQLVGYYTLVALIITAIVLWNKKKWPFKKKATKAPENPFVPNGEDDKFEI